MYRYRKLSAEQRQAIVAERRRHQLPLHRPPHGAAAEGWYLITAATYEHRAHFLAPAELTALECRLREALHAAEIRLAEWVILPNHYHLVVNCADLSRLGRSLGTVHGRSSRYVNQRDKTPGRKVWYRFSDRAIRGERHFETCRHYVFMNPVKHGYASNSTDWVWSSVGQFVREHGKESLEQLRRDYPLRAFGRGWDDLTNGIASR